MQQIFFNLFVKAFYLLGLKGGLPGTGVSLIFCRNYRKVGNN